jgi:ABC-type Fe3+/spermidine/putrescine transport system ATPase subunit
MLAPNRDTILEAQAVSLRYGRRAVLEQVTLMVAAGGMTALVGPNGSGKSTLLKALARLKAPSAGAVLLDGVAIARLPTAEVARRLSILPQGPSAPAGMTVAELVEQGRYPHAGPLRMLRRQDHDAIRGALSATGMTRFADRAGRALGRRAPARLDRARSRTGDALAAAGRTHDFPRHRPSARRSGSGGAAESRARHHHRAGAARPCPGRARGGPDGGGARGAHPQ